MMGFHKRQELGKRDERMAKKQTKLEGVLGGFSDDADTGRADWNTCSPELMKAVVVSITAMGGAVIFGLSRDKGAHSVTLMHDQDRKSIWMAGNADLDAEMSAILSKLSPG